MDEGAGVELEVDDVVVVVEVEDAVPDPVRVADAAIAESVESLLGSVRGTTNDVDADADDGAEGGVNVRGRGVEMGVIGVMGGGGCACAAIAVLGLSVSLFSVYGHAREMWEAKRIEGGEEWPAGECVSESRESSWRERRRRVRLNSYRMKYDASEARRGECDRYECVCVCVKEGEGRAKTREGGYVR